METMMKVLRVFVVGAVMWGVTVAGAAPDLVKVRTDAAAEAKTNDDTARAKAEGANLAAVEIRRQNAVADLSSRLDGGYTATSIGGDVLQAVGQAVLRKAVRAGWGELESKLAELAGCKATPIRFPNTCSTLGQARIEDLIASPSILLDAFTADVMAKLETKLSKLPEAAQLVGLAAAWATVGSKAVPARISTWLKDQIKGVAANAACPADPAAAVGWVVAQCYIASADLTGCNVDQLVATCTFPNPASKSSVTAVSDLAIQTFQAYSASSKEMPELGIKLFFEWYKLSDTANVAMLDNLEATFVGLVDRDWTRTVIGVAKIFGDSESDVKLIRIIGAVGQFAQTYAADGTVDPTAAREKVIEDLVTGLVDRTERDHGVVVGLGGALAVLAGARFDADNKQLAQPVRLTLGLGLDSYHACKCGFHGSLDVFDLGQYITYSSNGLDVSSPDVRSSVILGATAGFWFENRDTPMFIAAHASASPFVRTMDNKITYEAGLMFGIYVPLLDFN
jgi:hypothetical protein